MELEDAKYEDLKNIDWVQVSKDMLETESFKTDKKNKDNLLFRDKYSNVEQTVTSIHPLYGWICCKSLVYNDSSQIKIKEILRVDGVDVEK